MVVGKRALILLALAACGDESSGSSFDSPSALEDASVDATRSPDTSAIPIPIPRPICTSCTDAGPPVDASGPVSTYDASCPAPIVCPAPVDASCPAVTDSGSTAYPVQWDASGHYAQLVSVCDSITAGSNLGPPFTDSGTEDYSWPYLAGLLAAGQDYRVVNSGVPGQTMFAALGAIQSQLLAHFDSSASQHVVTMLCGGNDSRNYPTTGGYDGGPIPGAVAQIVSRERSYYDQAVAAGWSPIVLVYPDSESWWPDGEYAEYHAAMASTFADVPTERVIDLQAEIPDWCSHNAGDGRCIHPDMRVNVRLATVVARRLPAP
jgi:lysophospholipase L1-like esterase